MRVALLSLALAAALPAAAASRPVINWDEAEQHVGEEVAIEGRVMGVHCSPISCLLAFEPTFNRFTAVVQARSFDTFPPADLDRLYSGKRVRVEGKIELRDKKPEIVLERRQDLALASTKRREEHDAERAARAQADVMDRLADVLGRVEELTEQMAAVQERMDALLAQMEQREAALAAAQSTPPPAAPPPAPSYGEAQPRPAYETLRTVKRGMSRADVERLIGEPQYVEGGGRGWTTWYYGYGRSISFDARGRAQALVGFPAP